MSLYFPFSHGVQVFDVVPFEYFPTGQAVHVNCVIIWPSLHEVQCPFDGLHEVHVDEHASQDVDAVEVVYCIAGHVLHDDAVPPVKYVPALHAVQTLFAKLYPSLHFEHFPFV